MKRGAALLLALFLTGGAGDTAWASDHIVLGSWNIEHLGSRRGQPPKALAEHIDLAGVDVLVLQEIDDTDGVEATHTSSKLDAAFAELDPRPGHDWAYRLFPRRNPANTSQLTGVAWNRERVVFEAEFRIPVEAKDAPVWRRPPHAVKFSVVGAPEADFIVVPLHLKSNYDGEGPGRETRTREAAELVRWIERIRKELGDADIVLAGDFNCLDAREAALSILEEEGFRDLNRNDVTTYRKGAYSSPFDRFLVTEDQPEFRYSRQYVLTPADPEGHLDQLSDHFLILTAIRVLDD